MNLTARKSLYNIVGKVARYREAVTFLCHLTRRTPVVRHFQVTSVNLPESASRGIQVEYGSSTLVSTSRRVGAVKKAKAISQVYHLLSSTQPAFDSLLSQQTQKIIKEAKIHAEVQLLYHKLPTRYLTACQAVILGEHLRGCGTLD